MASLNSNLNVIALIYWSVKKYEDYIDVPYAGVIALIYWSVNKWNG